MWFADKDKSSGRDIFNSSGPLFPNLLQIVVEIYLTLVMQLLQKRYQKASSTTFSKTTLSKTPPYGFQIFLPTSSQINSSSEQRWGLASPNTGGKQRHGHTLHTSGSLWCNPSWGWDPSSISSELRWLDSHLPFLQLPSQDFFSPLQSTWSWEMNLVFQALKSASMLPCLLLTTLQSPSPRVITRWAPSIQSHLSTFLPTCKKNGWAKNTI